MRVPRKIKKQIPIGRYCYTLLNFDWATYNHKVKFCPFYSSGHVIDFESIVKSTNRERKLESLTNGAEYIEMVLEDHPHYGHEDITGNGGWCRLKPAGAVDDQCKSCSIKLDYKFENRKRGHYERSSINLHSNKRKWNKKLKK